MENAMRVRRFASVLLAGACVALLVGCGRSTPKEVRNSTASTTVSTQATTVSPPPSSPSPTPTPTPEQAVLTAYRRYWELYTQAVLNLDPTLVEGAAMGEELEGIRSEIADLRTRGRAIRVDVQLRPIVVEVRDDAAIVYDEFVNRSFTVDAGTKEPRQASGSGEVVRDVYYLHLMGDGVWKVTRSERQR
jgi:hypothetical protein